MPWGWRQPEPDAGTWQGASTQRHAGARRVLLLVAFSYTFNRKCLHLRVMQRCRESQSAPRQKNSSAGRQTAQPPFFWRAVVTSIRPLCTFFASCAPGKPQLRATSRKKRSHVERHRREHPAPNPACSAAACRTLSGVSAPLVPNSSAAPPHRQRYTFVHYHEYFKNS